MELASFFSRDGVDIQGLADWLDGLDHADRVAAIRRFKPRWQASLWRAADGFRPLHLGDFVPASLPPLTPVVHEGYNNQLPGLRRFRKLFCRPDRETPEPELWGYNDFFLASLIGPGYFVAIEGPREGEVTIDYYRVPAARPADWPEIVPNSYRLGRFVYDRTRDFMRGVSRHVSIGRAEIRGRLSNAHFVLCRQDPLAVASGPTTEEPASAQERR